MQVPPGRVPLTQFGDRLRMVRRDAGMRLEDLARELGVTKAAYSQWETNRRHPRHMRSVCLSIQMLTGVDAGWLETGDTPRTTSPDGPDGLPHLDSNQEPCGTWLKSCLCVPQESPQKAAS